MNNAADTILPPPAEAPDFRELKVLEELGTQHPVTQRELARKVGIAVGLANAILKRMARKGLIEVRNLDAKRLAYSITPKGMQEKTRLAYGYMERTVHFYKEARYRVKDNLLRAQGAGVRRVALYGINDVAEIVYLTLKELGLELAMVASPRHAGESWLGMPVMSAQDLASASLDAVVVADFDTDRERYPELKALAVRAWWLDS